jgi:FKBP-type peptidyl-prolyl cis-trans isomerase 2
MPGNEQRMALAKHGDTVRVHYICRLDDGKLFENTMDRDPMQFKIGEGRINLAFEQAIVGMNTGDSKTIKISADQALGVYLKQLLQVLDRRRIPPNLNLEAGQRLQVNLSDGQTVVVKVTEVSDSSVTIDSKHPLAGKDLTLDIQLVDIVSDKEEPNEK